MPVEQSTFSAFQIWMAEGFYRLRQVGFTREGKWITGTLQYCDRDFDADGIALTVDDVRYTIDNDTLVQVA